MDDHADQADRSEQGKPGRYHASEALIVKPGEEIERDRAIELAFAGAAGGKVHREILDAQSLFAGGEQVEQYLEADRRQFRREFAGSGGFEQEIPAHRIAEIHARQLAGQRVGHTRQLFAVRAVPFGHAGPFGEAAGDGDIGLARLDRGQHRHEQLGIVLVIGVHHRGIGCGGGAETFDRRARQAAPADPFDHANARVGQGQAARLVGRAVGRVVVHHHDFPAHRAERVRDPVHQGGEIVALVESRQHDREFQRCRHMGCQKSILGEGRKRHVHAMSA